VKKVKLLVNAIALANVKTGIGRYVQNLYMELERAYSDEFQITYFDGVSFTREMPGGPSDNARWSLKTDLFWRLPPTVGLGIRSLFHWKREWLFSRMAKEFDLYHEPGFFPFKVSSHVKTVFTIHDMSVQNHPEFHPAERVLFYKAFFESRSAQASEVLTVSQFSKSEILRGTGFAPERITVTPLGYVPSLFHPVDTEMASKITRRLGLPSRYFLFLGTGDPRKNMEIIPKALEYAHLEIPLAVAGWSGWGDRKEQGNVIPLGYVPDAELCSVITGAQALIFPSRYEGFGLPVLEAMACGCPVVTTKAASMPEVGGDAVLYMSSPDDVEGLAEILRRIVLEPGLRKKFQVAGPARAQKFSWEDTARITADVFRKALQR